MSNNESDENSADSQQQSEQQPDDSDQATAQSDEQATDQSGQPTDQTEEKQDEGDQATSQPEDEATAGNDQPAEQSVQVAEAEGQQTAKGGVGATPASDDTVASTGGEASPDGDEGSAAQPAKAGSPGPRKRLFRFVIVSQDTALNLAPDTVRTAFVPDLADYAFAFTVAGAADGNPARMIEDGWERVPLDGIMDFPFSTVEKKQFFIGVAIIPNSKVDPKAASSQSLQRTDGVHTDDFEKMKATDAATLVKKFPDGVFILQINLLAQYIQIVVAGSTTFEAELSKAKISPDDVVYNALSPATDNSGKTIGTTHDVVYWATNLHLKGRKYVP